MNHNLPLPTPSPLPPENKETWTIHNKTVYIDRRTDISEVSVERMFDGRIVCHLPAHCEEDIARSYIDYILDFYVQHYIHGEYITIFYVSGSFLFGIPGYEIKYPIHIEIDNEIIEPIATIQDEQIILRCQDSISEQQREELITKAVDKYRKRIARALAKRKRQGPTPEQEQYVVERFNYYANLFREENVQLQIIKDLPKLIRKRCQGACRPKERVIQIDYGKIAILPRPQIDHILIHELTHLQVPNHGKRFLHLMDLRLPKWREIYILSFDKLYLYQMLNSNSR